MTKRGGSSKFVGAGLSVPGIVQNGMILNSPELGLVNSGLAAELEEAIGIPVYIDKDVYMNALGENWKGAGQKYSNFVTVTIGTGIGSAMIIDNKVYRGAGGMAGRSVICPPPWMLWARDPSSIQISGILSGARLLTRFVKRCGWVFTRLPRGVLRERKGP